jgi:hypothetical protein
VAIRWHLATVAVVGDAACNARRRRNARRGILRTEGAPRVTGFGLEIGHFIVAINARHVLAGTQSMPSSRFLVSRTMTASAALATSTHSPPFAPE